MAQNSPSKNFKVYFLSYKISAAGVCYNLSRGVAKSEFKLIWGATAILLPLCWLVQPQCPKLSHTKLMNPATTKLVKLGGPIAMEVWVSLSVWGSISPLIEQNAKKVAII